MSSTHHTHDSELYNLSTLTKMPMNDFKSIFDYVGGRKFLFVVLISIGAFSLAFSGKIDYNQLLEFLTWIFGLYAGANVGQKIGTK